jgi:hypothetical protein
MAKRKRTRRKKAPRRAKRAGLLRRHPWRALALMLALSAMLLWGVVSVSGRGGSSVRRAPAGGGTHSDGITDADREQLNRLLESLDEEGGGR